MSRRTLATLLVIAAAVGAFELYFLARKFPVYQPTAYNRHPRAEIHRLGPIHIGIVLGHHGASFVRLPPESRQSGSIPPTVVTEMRQELVALPLKFTAEAGLYFTVLSFAWFGTVGVWKRLRTSSSRSIAIGGLFAVATLLVQVPLLWGYDSSVFSNWVGPGALSYSYPAAEITFIPGVSIAQRFVLEALHSGVVHILAVPSRWLSYIDITVPRPETWFGASLLAAGVYGAVGVLLALPVSALRRRREAGS